jgi:hypothetical protein
MFFTLQITHFTQHLREVLPSYFLIEIHISANPVNKSAI